MLCDVVDPSTLASFNESWLTSFRNTPAFILWDENTDPVIFDLVEPRHPCEGQAHLLEDVGIRLVNGLHDLQLNEKLGPTQEAISKGFASGSEGVWKMVEGFKKEVERRKVEYNNSVAAAKAKEATEQDQAVKEKAASESAALQQPSSQAEPPAPIAGQGQSCKRNLHKAGADLSLLWDYSPGKCC